MRKRDQYARIQDPDDRQDLDDEEAGTTGHRRIPIVARIARILIGSFHFAQAIDGIMMLGRKVYYRQVWYAVNFLIV